MSAAIATMSLVRTIGVRLRAGVKPDLNTSRGVTRRR